MYSVAYVSFNSCACHAHGDVRWRFSRETNHDFTNHFSKVTMGNHSSGLVAVLRVVYILGAWGAPPRTPPQAALAWRWPLAGVTLPRARRRERKKET